MRTTTSADGLTRTCGRCKEIKPVEEFNRRTHPNGKIGYHGYCKPCNVAHNRFWQYGITQEDYEQMLLAQGGVCAMCGAGPSKTVHGTFSLHIDHDHSTGKVRALLCHACNKGLGQFGDSIERLEQAIAYLKQHQPVEV